jgi:hypothetical protein
MKRFATAVLALSLIAPAQAMPVPQLAHQDAGIVQIAEGCGAGFHRVAGRCVRNVVAAPRVVAPRVVVRPVVVRPWARRAYFGTVVAGVTLGAIIAASAAPPPPAGNVCWYWTSPAQNQGYWDYC